MAQDDLKTIKKKAEHFESQYTRLKQEFKDYIEVTRKNEERAKREIKVDFAKRLLVVADSLDRVSDLNDAPSMEYYSENIKKNIGIIYTQLLIAVGLTPINPKEGDEFDERLHTAVELEYVTAYPDNLVFHVIRKGYQIENNVVRPSEVIVSKYPGEAPITKTSLLNRFFRWIAHKMPFYNGKHEQ